jgi:hypothetical protein
MAKDEGGANRTKTYSACLRRSDDRASSARLRELRKSDTDSSSSPKAMATPPSYLCLGLVVQHFLLVLPSSASRRP